ncbi:unnamed protein product [Protopolystoma xenopodis]|uniref:Uncharacterized protein n=1 Tax=Protopolystoma xenopodis TaxID=117903 RepID=A0A448WK90_9PLAT|nr:unnamed protein product [Protopolystoma xenopodis]
MFRQHLSAAASTRRPLQTKSFHNSSTAGTFAPRPYSQYSYYISASWQYIFISSLRAVSYRQTVKLPHQTTSMCRIFVLSLAATSNQCIVKQHLRTASWLPVSKPHLLNRILAQYFQAEPDTASIRPHLHVTCQSTSHRVSSPNSTLGCSSWVTSCFLVLSRSRYRAMVP